MKLKFLVLTLISLLFIQYGYSQSNTDKTNDNKIKLKKETIVQDSALATWPILVSVVEKDLKTKAEVEESFGEYSVKFHPEPDKGIIYIQFENLPKEIKPELFLTNTKGEVIYSIKAKTRLNVINLRKIPSGTYLFTLNVNHDEEITTWEIVKE